MNSRDDSPPGVQNMKSSLLEAKGRGRENRIGSSPLKTKAPGPRPARRARENIRRSEAEAPQAAPSAKALHQTFQLMANGYSNGYCKAP